MRRYFLRQVVGQVFGAGSKRIEGFRIKFSCEKSNESNPNKAQVEIYNLSESTRSMMELKGAKFQLQAGYDGNLESFFFGDITKVVHKIDGLDVISTLEVRDGDNKHRNAFINKGYPPNTTVAQVFQDLTQSFKPLGVVMVGVPKGKFGNGYTASGLSREVMNTLCKQHDLEWSFQHEVLQIVPKKGFLLNLPVVVSPATGLIGSPEKTEKGIQFKTLLNSKLVPGTRIKLESRLINGIYKIRKVSHEGDSHQGDFISTCDAAIK